MDLLEEDSAYSDSDLDDVEAPFLEKLDSDSDRVTEAFSFGSSVSHRNMLSRKRKGATVIRRHYGERISVQKRTGPHSPRESLSSSLPPKSIFSYFVIPDLKSKNHFETIRHENKNFSEVEFSKETDNAVQAKSKQDKINSNDVNESIKIKSFTNFDRDTRLFFDYDMFDHKFHSKRKHTKTTFLFNNIYLFHRVFLFPLNTNWWIQRLSFNLYIKVTILYIIQIIATFYWVRSKEVDIINTIEAVVPWILFSFYIILLLYCVNMEPKVIAAQKQRKLKRTVDDRDVRSDSGNNAEFESSSAEDSDNNIRERDFNTKQRPIRRIRKSDQEERIVTEHLTYSEIAREINAIVERKMSTSSLEKLAIAISCLTAMGPCIFHISRIMLSPYVNIYIPLLTYGLSLFPILSYILSTYFVSQQILSELLVAEQWLYKKYLFAKFFKKISSQRKAKKSKLPYFRLDSPRNIYAWIMVRCDISKFDKPNEKSSDEIVKFIVHFALFLVCGFIFGKGLFVEDDTSYTQLILNLPGSLFMLWLFTFIVFAYRYHSLNEHYLRKRNVQVLLHNEVLNIMFDLTAGKDHLSSDRWNELKNSMDILKTLIKQLKCSEPESKTKRKSGILNDNVYNVFMLLTASFIGTELAPVLGFKLKINKLLK